MNLLLIDASELATDGTLGLRDRRADHLRQVLRVEVGSSVRIGILQGPLGLAEVLTKTASEIVLRCQFETELPPPPRDHLLLAVPRPKVLRRVLQDAAAMGFAKIALVRTWRVEKSHLGAEMLSEFKLREALLLGLEQGRRTYLPAVRVFPLFKPFVEDELESWITPQARFVAHPGTDHATALHLNDEAFALAIGPEGGWIEYELEALAARGFQTCALGAHPLRVEAAFAAAWSQLRFARELGRTDRA